MRIGAPDGFATYYLAEALRDFVARNPGLRLQLAPAPQLTPLARREVDVVVGLDKPEEGRFVARKLTDYSLGVYASAAYLAAHEAPREVGDLADHRLIGYVEEYAFSSALDYVRELYGGAPTSFECASGVDPVRGSARRPRPRRRPRFHRPALRRSAPRAARAARDAQPIGSSPTRTRAASAASAPSANT